MFMRTTTTALMKETVLKGRPSEVTEGGVH
jgi:hypothetical protein